MRYDKQPIDFAEQIALLKERGMQIDNESQAFDNLYSISYFRLASYWRHREQKDSRMFRSGTTFEESIRLYRFDQELRSLIFAAIQNIEVAARTRISHFLSMKYGAFWFLDHTLFKDEVIHLNCLDKLKDELDRSHEDFITEHNAKYSEPPYPPSWKTLEVTSFGTLSKLYGNLADNDIKKTISRSFRLPSYIFLENWMKCAAVLRNCCAHHARLWNRRFSMIPRYPIHLPGAWITVPLRRPEKLYGQLCCLAYLEQTIHPNSDLKNKILTLIDQNPMIKLKAMGFPEGWNTQPLWSDCR